MVHADIFFALQLVSPSFLQNEFGVWEIFLPNNADGSPAIPHGSRVKVIFIDIYLWYSPDLF